MNKPQIQVLRFSSEKDWTLSKFSILDTPRGVGIEDEKRVTKVYGETRIDNGIYEIDFTYSPKFSKHFFVDDKGFISKTKTERFNHEHLVIEVLGVKGFSKIRWHWGNSDDDTEGCYIVGSDFGKLNNQTIVVDSKKKYMEIYPIIFQLWQHNKSQGIKTFVEYKEAA